MQIRQRRTTVMSGRGIEDQIPDFSNIDENWKESQSSDDDGSQNSNKSKDNNAKDSYDPLKDTNQESLNLSQTYNKQKMNVKQAVISNTLNSSIQKSATNSSGTKLSGSNSKNQQIQEDEEFDDTDFNLMGKSGDMSRISLDRKVNKNYFSVLESVNMDPPLKTRNTTVNIYRKLSNTQQERIQTQQLPKYEDSDDKEDYALKIKGLSVDIIDPMSRLSEPQERQNNSMAPFQAQFVSPRDEFGKKSLGITQDQEDMIDQNLNRPRNRTTGGKKNAVRRENYDENDILGQIESEEQLAAMMQDDEDDELGGNIMDRLLNEADVLNEERALRETSYSKSGQDSHLDQLADTSLGAIGAGTAAYQSQNSGQRAQGAAAQAKRGNARFSTSFDNKQLKSSLVQTHSIYRKMRKESNASNEKTDTQLHVQSNHEEENKEQSKNDDSLDTEEDLDNYLEKLEDKDQTNRQSKSIEEEKKADPNNNSSGTIDPQATGKSISNISKISGGGGQKDLIDVIQEVEGEDDENFLDSDESFTKEFYQTMHQDVLINGMNPKERRRSQKIQELTREDWDYKDLVKLIDWNERRYQEIAKSRLKENSSINLKNTQTLDIKIRTFSNFINLNSVSKKMVSERSFSQSRATCLGLSEDLLMIGNTDGQVWMFDRESEEDYSNFTEKSKEFIGNSVTAIDVHPNRTEYVVIGYERGQMVLFDVTEPKKSIKVIKDHHKNAGIVNIKFVDWYGKTPPKQVDQVETDQTKNQILQEEDKRAWMFISIDQNGKVVINTVQKTFFVMNASKHVIIDPTKEPGPTYSALACRFKSKLHGKGEYDDIPIIALGNSQEIRIMEARTNGHDDFYTLSRPKKVYNRSSNEFTNFQPLAPALTWGYGHSPVLKDRPHSLLAISWGPLVQLVVLIDHEDTETPFIDDGYYILRNFNTSDQKLIKQPKIRKSVRFLNVENNKEDEDDDIRELLNQPKYSLQQDSMTGSSIVSEEKELFFEDVYDDSQAFNLPGLYIEMVQFISDSTLMVITQSQEIRVLHTSSFLPETYDADKIKQQTKNSLRQASALPKQSPEIEYNLRLPSVQKSEWGGGFFNQTIKFFDSKLVVLTSKNIQTCNHLSWQESIAEFKRIVQDDLIKVFSRLLDIYKGKVKGYAGIPDNSTVREIQLKAGLKLSVREIICEKIEKTQLNSLLIKSQAYQNIEGRKNGDQDDEDVKLALRRFKEFQEERRKKYQTLIRISIEFCVELKDCYFLFYDLFLLFKEEELEDLFIEELEPFILAGKFQEWEIPNQILQEHVIKYYQNDPNKSDVLEKIIINLNFNQIEKKIVLEFIHFSEQNFLSTAILFLYTQVIEKKDNTSCVQVLCSLFDLYKKSQQKLGSQQISMIDLQMLREFEYESEEKKQIEKSQIYLGYKILWAIRLFIDGKKFPQGNIRERKWRSYIHDVIQFLSTPEYLKYLLEIDAETLFQVIAILFYPSKPFELVQQGRDLIANPSLKSLTHIEFLKDLDTFCMNEKTHDSIKNQYLFFISNVVAKSTGNNIQGISPDYFYNIARELMNRHRRYLEFNKNLHEMSNKKKKKITDQLSKSGDSSSLQIKQQQIDELKYIQKTENDFINLFKLSEPLDEIQIIELLKLAEFTQFNQVKVYLYEKKEEYIKCLQMLLTDYKTNEAWTAEQQAERVIKWIKDKLALLEERAEKSKSVLDRNTFEQFKREVTQNIKKIVVMNPKETIALIDEKFGANHKEMIDMLSRDPQEQMLYLETLLEEQDLTIQETIKNYGLNSANPKEAKKYIEYLKLHLRLCCLLKKERVLAIVERMVKQSYYPIEDCLQICQENDQIEAAFLLNKKLGKYFDSVRQGLTIIQSRVDLTKLKIEIYHARKKGISLAFPCNHEYLIECNMFDSVFKKILKICRKNSKEVEQDKEELIWFVVIDAIYQLKMNDIVSHKLYCKEFFQVRLNIFAEALIRVIPFRNFLNHLLAQNKDLQFYQYQEVILQLFSQVNSEAIILQNANNSIYKVNSELFQQFKQQTQKGILFRQRFCFLCKRFMDQHLQEESEISTQDGYSQGGNNLSDGEDDEDEENFFGDQQPYYYDSSKEMIKIFACRHTFHIRCLKKHYKQRHDEVEEIFLRKVEKLRCPTCNLKNYDIDQETKTTKGGPGAKGASAARNKAIGGVGIGSSQRYRDIAIVEDNNMASGNSSKSNNNSSNNSQTVVDDALERKIQARQYRMTMKSQSIQNRQLMKLSKQMQYFESGRDSEGLLIKDFKKI